MRHSTIQPNTLHCMLPSKLSRCPEVHTGVQSQFWFQFDSISHLEPSWLCAPLEHQQQTLFPSETPRCSRWLWRLWQNLVPSDGELYTSRCPGDGSHCIHTSITLPLVYVSLEWHRWYTFRRGCSYSVAVYTTPGDVYAFLLPIAPLYLSAIAMYLMPHSPHVYLALRFCFEYHACGCTCLAIIVFHRSETYTPIFTLSITMPSVLHILHWFIIGLWCLFLLIHIQIIAILAIITVNIT